MNMRHQVDTIGRVLFSKHHQLFLKLQRRARIVESCTESDCDPWSDKDDEEQLIQYLQESSSTHPNSHPGPNMDGDWASRLKLLEDGVFVKDSFKKAKTFNHSQSRNTQEVVQRRQSQLSIQTMASQVQMRPINPSFDQSQTMQSSNDLVFSGYSESPVKKQRPRYTLKNDF